MMFGCAFVELTLLASDTGPLFDASQDGSARTRWKNVPGVIARNYAAVELVTCESMI
jgi:hypothetical protein